MPKKFKKVQFLKIKTKIPMKKNTVQPIVSKFSVKLLQRKTECVGCGRKISCIGSHWCYVDKEFCIGKFQRCATPEEMSIKRKAREVVFEKNFSIIKEKKLKCSIDMGMHVDVECWICGPWVKFESTKGKNRLNLLKRHFMLCHGGTHPVFFEKCLKDRKDLLDSINVTATLEDKKFMKPTI